MNPILELRRQAGITQQDMAARAGTSQSTVAAYESGSKSPTVRTVERIADTLGFEAVVGFTPRISIEEHRSLCFHRALAQLVRADPGSSMRRARRHLKRLQSLHPHARELLDRWSIWLRLPVDDLIARMTAPDLPAREMRQVSPFAGQLNAGQRQQILAAARRERGP